MKPKICIIIDGGALQVVFSNMEADIEIFDFDSLNFSTTQKEELFLKKMGEYPNILSN